MASATWRRNRAAYRSLGWVCAGTILSLWPHLQRPLPATPVQAGLIAALIVVNLCAMIWFDKAPCVAVQSYWYSAWVVIAVMVVVDVRSGVPGFPYILAIPSVATVVIRWFVSWRASLAYGLAALALVIPSGVIYQEIGQALPFVAVVILAVTIGRRKRDTTAQGDKLQAMTQEVREGTRALLDVIPEA